MIQSFSVERLNQLLLNGELDGAEAELQHLAGDSPSALRIHGHYQGLLAFYRGQFVSAKQKLEFTCERFGDNVNLLRDLIICQYRLRDWHGFRQNLGVLEQRLRDMESTLSTRTLLECELSLGKFLEEEARLAPALEFYNRALTRAFKPEHRLRVLIQKARWHALYDPQPELSELYRELISAPLVQLNQDLLVELDHSLMLIELQLVGADHAALRLATRWPHCPEIDQRLLLFDFTEGLLHQGLEIPRLVKEKISGFSDLDPFESHVEKLVQGSLEASTRIQELTVLAMHLSWSTYLRLLCLAANQETQTQLQQELQKKIQLIVRGLDERSQKLWNQRLKTALQANEIKLDYSTQTRSVAIQGRHVDLSKKKMGQQLMGGLAQKSQLSVDEAIQMLWGAPFSPEHYHRLRMGIHRLNTLINKVTGMGKIIEVDSQHVRLRPEVRLRQIDDVRI